MTKKNWSAMFWFLANSTLAALLFVKVGYAGLADPDSYSNEPATSVQKTSKPKPYSPVNTTAQGSCTGSSSACANTPCASGDRCECVSFTGLAMKFPGAGATQMSAEINLDVNQASGSGVSVCFVAYGQGTGTIKSGSSINVFFNGRICGTGTGIDSTSGDWMVTGGSGSLSSANGTGFAAISHSDSIGTHPCVITMDGTFRKTP